MKTFQYLSSIILALCFFVTLLAQDNTVAVNLPPAPEAAAIGEYGDIPVGEFTGVPNIQIPLHTAQFRSLSVPISLSYHAQGIRVSEEASWVGLGWALNAGGSITRSIRGYGDFGEYFPACNGDLMLGYLAEDLPETPADFDDDGDAVFLDSDFLGSAKYGYGRNQMFFNPGVVVDSQSDLYNFSFGGYSGKFVFDKEGNVLLLSKSDLQFERFPSWAPDAPFAVITPDGTRYLFGETDISRQRTHSDAISTEDGQVVPDEVPFCPSYISTWFLTSIQHPSGYHIALNYEREESRLITLPQYSETFEDLFGGEKCPASDDSNCISTAPTPDFYSKRTKTYNITSYDNVYLASITSDYWVVDFVRIPRDDIQNGFMLDKIDVSILDGSSATRIKTIDFHQSAFTSTASSAGNWVDNLTNSLQNILTDYGVEIDDNTLRSRLRLNSLSIEEGDDGIRSDDPLTYNFAYNEQASLPDKSSFSVDHWGYANNADNEQLVPGVSQPAWFPALDCDDLSQSSGTLTPSGELDATFVNIEEDVDREPNEFYTEAWLLQGITYPTGGRSVFDYEPNDFIDEYTLNSKRFFRNNIWWDEACNAPPPERETIGFIGEGYEGADPEDVPPTLINLQWTLSKCPDVDPDGCDFICLESINDGTIPDEVQGFEIHIINVATQDTVETIYSWDGTYGYTIDGFYDYWTFSGSFNLLPDLYDIEIANIFSADGNVLDLAANLEELVVEIIYPVDIEVSEQREGAGMRVQSITNYDHLNQVALTRTFDYTENGETTGEVYNRPEYATFERIMESNQCLDGLNLVEFSYYDYVTRSSSSRLPLSNNFVGQFVGYSLVTTSIGESQEGGYTTKSFHNDGTFRNPLQFIFADIPFYVNQLDGSLLEQHDYDQSGTLVRKLENTYVKNDFPDEFNWNYELTKIGFLENHPTNSFQWVPFVVAYADAPQWTYMERSVETYYGSDGGEVRKVSDYEYEAVHFNLTRQTLTDEQNINQITNFEYAADLLAEDASYGVLASDTVHMTGIPLRISPPSGIEYQTLYNTEHFVPEKFTEIFSDNSSIVRSEVTSFEDGYPLTIANYGFPGEEVFTWGSGLLIERTYLEHSQTYTYELRQLRSMIAVDLQETVYEYDKHRRLARIKERDDQVITDIAYTYGGPNEVTTTTTFDGGEYEVQDKSSLMRYDGLGRLTHAYNNGRLDNEIIYDLIGRIQSQTYLVGNLVDFTYDNSPLNRVILETLPDGNTIAYDYFAENSLYKQQVTDEENDISYQFTDILDRQVKVEDALGGITQWAFDGQNRLDYIITPMGHQYDYGYDIRNRLNIKIVPGAGTTTYTYHDEKDLLKSQTDANGITQSFDYDDYQRLTDTYLGQLGSGDLMIRHEYYTLADGGLHMDKIKRSSYRVLDGGGNFVVENFTYDDYGRAVDTRYQHLLGADFSTNDFDLADRLRRTELDHNAYREHTIVQAYEYDVFDRTTSVHHTLTDFFSAQVASYSYNDRDQMTGKVLGSEMSVGPYSIALYAMGYQYDAARGWLRQINSPFSDGEPLPVCEDYEPDEFDPDPTPPGYYADGISLIEYLERRLELNIQIDPEVDCPVVECPVATCTAADIQQALADLDEVVLEGISIVRDVPCADGSTETVTEVVLTEENFPTALYRVRLCDNSERYVLEAYLDLLPAPYETLQEIPVAGPNQRIPVTTNGETVRLLVSEVVGLVIAGEDIVVGDYVPCGEPDCGFEFDCSPAEVLLQAAILETLQNELTNNLPADGQEGITVYEVELCNGRVIYVLEDELSYFDGTTALVTDNFDVEWLDEELPGQIDPMGEEYDGISGLFHMQFGYTPKGNIDWYDIAVYNRAKVKQEFDYDEISRLTSMVYSEFTPDGNHLTMDNKYGVPNIDYDADGNITNLMRRGISHYCDDEVPFYDVIDALSYQYDGVPNRLTSLTELADREYGFKTGTPTASYGYDEVGNMTSDGHRGLVIEYNYLNLPESITSPDGTLTLTYDASGRKLRQTMAYISGEEVTIDYVNGVEYRNGRREAVYHEEGRLYFPAEEGGVQPLAYREYFIQDHLGNTRLVIGDKNRNNFLDATYDRATDEIIQENNYYPFGMAMEGPWVQHSGEKVRYQYNGKELNEDIGLYEYGFRWYDPGIGRFTGVDPIAERFAHVSVYNYAENSPIGNIDLHGLQAIPTQVVTWIVYKYGQLKNRIQGYANTTIQGAKQDNPAINNMPISQSAKEGLHKLQTNAGFAGLMSEHLGPAKELATLHPMGAVISGLFDASQALEDGDYRAAAMAMTFVAIDGFTGGKGSKAFKFAGNDIVGEIIEEGGLIGGTFSTKSSNIGIEWIGEATLKDGQLHISDLAVYAQDVVGNDAKNGLGSGNIKQFLAVLIGYAKNQGHDSVRITGKRLQNSSSANPGHEIDFTVNIRQ
ncbi:MAG: RHS repeat-associated core domain-containing protein [Bacteroidota bacterium]